MPDTNVSIKMLLLVFSLTNPLKNVQKLLYIKSCSTMSGPVCTLVTDGFSKRVQGHVCVCSSYILLHGVDVAVVVVLCRSGIY